MLSQSPFLTLIRKESRVVMPLAVGVAAVCLLLMLLLLVLDGDRHWVYFSCLVLFPNLVALGAPALQVGQEEESGTLGWQRSLPIDWRQAFASKFLAGLVGTLLVWVIAGLGLALAVGAKAVVLEKIFPVGAVPANEVLRLLSFSLMLLSVSTFSAWWFRSPAWALVATLPLTILLTFTAVGLANWFAERLVSRPAIERTEGYLITTLHPLFSIVILVVAWITAGRRWLRPARNWFVSSVDVDPPMLLPYRPTALPGMKQPSRWRALFWQANRQAVGIYAFVALAVAVAGVWEYFSFGNNGFVNPWIIIAVHIGAALLGTACFVGDTNRQRYRVLAQLGVGRGILWFSRCLVPMVLCAVLIVVTHFRYSAAGQWGSAELALVTLSIVGIFVCGQIVSIWAMRPVISYFGGPLVFAVCAIVAALTFSLYPEFLWIGFVSVAILGLITFRMLRLWTDGDRRLSYHARFVGWIGLAMLPIFIIPVVRIWTAPSDVSTTEVNQLVAAAESSIVAEEKAVAAEQPEEEESPEKDYTSLSLSAYPFDVLRPGSLSDVSQALEKFRAGELEVRIDGYSAGVLREILKSVAAGVSLPELKDENPLEGILTLVLEQIDTSPSTLLQSDWIDEFEAIAAESLIASRGKDLISAERRKELLAMLRTPEERRRDRRRAVVSAWRTLEVAEQDPLDVANFGGYYGYRPRLVFAYEQWRSQRYAMLATKISLEQLAEGLSSQTSEAYWNRILAFGGVQDQRTFVTPTAKWCSEFEGLIEDARRELEELEK